MVPLREVERSRGGTDFGEMIVVLEVIEFKLLLIHLSRNMGSRTMVGQEEGGGTERDTQREKGGKEYENAWK